MAQSQMAQPPAPAQSPRQKSFLRDTLEIVFLALVLYVVIQYAVLTVHVLGSSMYSTRHDNDLLVASKISYKLHPPQRGDIIVFKPPDEASRDFIKRVIALPGERIRIANSVVYINGQVLHEPYLPERWTYNNNWPSDGQDKVVPPNEYFVMGITEATPATREFSISSAKTRFWEKLKYGFGRWATSVSSAPSPPSPPGRKAACSGRWCWSSPMACNAG